MHGSRTHQSVRNVKSTRGYVRADVIKGQRGMMGVAWRFGTSQMFRGYWMLIRKLCKYLCAPANITEDTVAISQRFHVVKVWKIHTLENPLNKAASRKCGSFAKPKFRDGSTRNEIHISIWNYRFGRPRHKFMPRGTFTIIAGHCLSPGPLTTSSRIR